MALAILATAPLLARRRYPLSVFWIVLAAGELFHLSAGFDATATFLACLIAAYTAALYSPHRGLALVGALVGTVVLVATHRSNVPTLQPRMASLLLLLPVALVGHAVYTWARQTQALEREQKEATGRAVAQERARIARELHDVITHHVSVMLVQAGAARKVMRMAPTEAEEMLLAIEGSGRSAMTELRHAMDLLTLGDAEDLSDDAALRPTPSLSVLPALVDRVRNAGVQVTLEVRGAPRPLPPGMDLAAYRVVQEALTNAMKHAQGAQVRITVDHGPQQLTIDVTDSGGPSVPTVGTGSGHGLIGLKERIDLYGGSLDAGPLPSGGFRVRAALPVASTTEADGSSTDLRHNHDQRAPANTDLAAVGTAHWPGASSQPGQPRRGGATG